MKFYYLLAIAGLLALAGCSSQRMDLPQPAPKEPPVDKSKLSYQDDEKFSFRSRRNIPVKDTRYEGSLWKDESSWGNLLRDHRARFRNDVLMITDVQRIINIQEVKKPAAPITPLAQAGENQAAAAANILEAAAEVAGVSDVEVERNEVLRSISQISARVIDVLPNGNMIVLGEKVDYRQQNSVRYVTKIRGIIRPEDVTPTNEVSSLKLARSEVNTKRQVQTGRINLSALAPLLGKQKTRALKAGSRLSGGNRDQKNQQPPPR